MLPQAFLCLLSSAIVLTQTTRQLLSLNKVSSFTLPNNPPAFLIPSGEKLTVTVAICTEDTGEQRFFLTNASFTTPDNPGRAGGKDVFEIILNKGHGVFTGPFLNGGVLAVEGRGSFEVAVSSSGPMHEVLSSVPLLGDTTSNQAILFSAPFLSPEEGPPPSWPNYTLPQANLSLPLIPQTAPTPTFSLVIGSTTPRNSAPLLTDIPQTGCALTARQAESVGVVENQTLWLRDSEGWRGQWLIRALTPGTNYTAYIIQDGTKVSGPLYFTTKSASFPCSLVHSLPYCPSVAYSVPIPGSLLLNGRSSFDSTNLPTSISDPIISSLSNFSTNLLTFPCGRDAYSPIVTCKDCQTAYRRWLCTVSFTRCGEASPDQPDSFTTMPVPATATGRGAAQPTGTTDGKQQVLSALVPVPVPTDPGKSIGRNPNLPAMSGGYSMLLPCLETCTAVDRTCPVFLKFRCPVPRFNAGASYGVGYIDGFNGREKEGVTGVAQDRWGNVWCNGG